MKKAVAPKAEPKKAAPKKAAPKKAAAPKAAAPKAAPAPWMPMLGEKCLHNGNIIEVTSFDPPEATVFTRRSDVVASKPYPLAALEGFSPLRKQELYEKLY